MKKNLLKIAIFSFAVLFVLSSCSKQDTSTSPVSQNVNSSKYIENQYIVVLSDAAMSGVQSSNGIHGVITNLLNSQGIDPSLVFAEWDVAINGFAANITALEAARLAKDPRVAYVEQDQKIQLSDDKPINSYTKESQIQVQNASWGIDAVGGSVAATTSTGKAWIIDTGIDFDHPDLNVNRSLGKNYVTSGSDKRTIDDLNGHGTHVAGIIAAKNNSIGSLGVCAGATVVAVKVLNAQGSGTTSGVISGVNYVAGAAASNDVANMSLGGGVSTTLDNAVYNASARCKFCVAAGNESSDANNSSPARVNRDGRVFTISAYDNLYVFAYFSNYGNPPVDYSAPGVSIFSLYKNGGTATMSGTSMATPFVCGIILANNGTINTGSAITGDPDGTTDPRAVR